MKTLTIQGDVLKTVVVAMSNSEIFGSISEAILTKIAEKAELDQFEDNEVIIKQKTVSDSFFLLIKGEVAIITTNSSDETTELGRIKGHSVIGDIGLLLEQPRTATIKSIGSSMLLKFDRSIFDYIAKNHSEFGIALSKFLALRVQQLSNRISLPEFDPKTDAPTSEVIKMIPFDFIIRHRVLPLVIDKKTIKIGLVNNPNQKVLTAIHNHLPGLELKLLHINNSTFDDYVQSFSGVEDWYATKLDDSKVESKAKRVTPSKLNSLLKRIIAEGASDLHLSAGQIPRWRLNGEISPLEGTKMITETEVYDLLTPVMTKRAIKEFHEQKDVDFAYSINDIGRFRVNMFHEDNGVSASLRVIPSNILTFEQLGIPEPVKKLCELSKGLILVTGPTGSGKSTTLASMIDYINKNRKLHIITIEDPIEFIHHSDKALVTQREIGDSASGFARALRAALREDPDVVLVGELRDLETIALALEIANTGHLVLGTLHTSSAIGTVNRVIDVFPVDQQNQIRTTLSETLQGVIAQALCKNIRGGRVAAFEVMINNMAISSLIREEKTIQIQSVMQTTRDIGNSFLNDDLYRLANERKIDQNEAMSKSINKDDLARRLGVQYNPNKRY
jgi:twitching motility protein PilT